MPPAIQVLLEVVDTFTERPKHREVFAIVDSLLAFKVEWKTKLEKHGSPAPSPQDGDQEVRVYPGELRENPCDAGSPEQARFACLWHFSPPKPAPDLLAVCLVALHSCHVCSVTAACTQRRHGRFLSASPKLIACEPQPVARRYARHGQLETAELVEPLHSWC